MSNVSHRSPALNLVALVLAAILALAGCTSSKDNGTSPSASASKIAKLLQDGVVAQTSGNLDLARSKYLEVVNLDPTNKVAHYDLGVIYQQLNSVDEAATEYNKAIAIDKNYKSAIFNLAVLETNRNRTHAIELYRTLLKLNPKDANVHFNLGLVLKAVGQTAQGQAELNTAFRLNPALRKRLSSTSPAASTTPASSPTS